MNSSNQNKVPLYGGILVTILLFLAIGGYLYTREESKQTTAQPTQETTQNMGKDNLDEAENDTRVNEKHPKPPVEQLTPGWFRKVIATTSCYDIVHLTANSLIFWGMTSLVRMDHPSLSDDDGKWCLQIETIQAWKEAFGTSLSKHLILLFTPSIVRAIEMLLNGLFYLSDTDGFESNQYKSNKAWQHWYSPITDLWNRCTLSHIIYLSLVTSIFIAIAALHYSWEQNVSILSKDKWYWWIVLGLSIPITTLVSHAVAETLGILCIYPGCDGLYLLCLYMHMFASFIYQGLKNRIRRSFNRISRYSTTGYPMFYHGSEREKIEALKYL